MKFKMVSVRELVGRARETINRFPLLSVFLCVGAINQLYMDIYHDPEFTYLSRNISMTLLVLVPVLYAIRIMRESKWIANRPGFLIELAAVAAAGFYFCSLPEQTLIAYYWAQFIVLFISAFLLCFVCAKQGARDDNFYWRLHATLFTRLLITGLYTLVILGGTSAALGAITVLFRTALFLHYESKVVIVTLWVFAPLFFISGVPAVSGAAETAGQTPNWLKNIGIYVLIPLTTVYLGILYAYGIKILAQWQLPDGYVAYLVLSSAAFGIATLLVIFPSQNDENLKWCRWFSRYFYFAQIPLLFLLFVAIFTRVFEYGVTLRRYYVAALAIWLLFVTVFMILRKNRNLIVIPLSLFLISMVSIVGPWSAFNSSCLSQRNRLLGMLEAHNLIRDGRIVPATESLSHKVRADISSIASYLQDYGRLQSMSSFTGTEKNLTPESFTEAMGFKLVGPYSHETDRKSFSYQCGKETFIFPVGGCQSFMRFQKYIGTQNKNIISVQENNLTVEFDPGTSMFQFSDDQSHVAHLKLQEVVDYFKTNPPGDKNGPYIYAYQDGGFDIKCLFWSLSGWEDEAGMHFSTVNVDFFIKRE